MLKIGKIGLSLSVVCLLAFPALASSPEGSFNNPPSSLCSNWVTAFPYQRNVLFGFGTNPDNWPEDPTGSGRVDFQPGVNCEHYGTNDADWYGSDWGDGDGIEWFDQDPTATVTATRQGVIGIYDDESTSGWITLHLDNSPDPNPLKHVYIEMEYYTDGSGNLGNPQYSLPAGTSLATCPDYSQETLADGWTRLNVCVAFEPNPEWEEITLSFNVDDYIQGTVLVDYIHVATECVVPEPATMALLALGGLAMLRRKHR